MHISNIPKRINGLSTKWHQIEQFHFLLSSGEYLQNKYNLNSELNFFLEIALPISDIMEWFLYFSSKPEWRNNFNYAFELIHFVLAYTLRQQVKIWTNQYVFIFKLSSFDIYKNQSNFDKIIISVWLKQNMKLNSDLWSSHIKWKKYLFYPWLMMCSHEI